MVGRVMFVPSFFELSAHLPAMPPTIAFASFSAFNDSLLGRWPPPFRSFELFERA